MTSPATADARTLNWRFVAPSEPAGMLLLAVGDETHDAAVVLRPGSGDLAGALSRGPYPAVAAPDLGAWAPGRPGGAAHLLARLATAVGPGGWLYVGFGNAWFPCAPCRPASSTGRTARRILRRAGLSDVALYAALPDQRRPALLVPMDRPEELDHVLNVLFLNYLPGDSSWPAVRRHLLAALRWGASTAPHRMRVHLVPAVGVLARRPV